MLTVYAGILNNVTSILKGSWSKQWCFEFWFRMCSNKSRRM